MKEIWKDVKDYEGFYQVSDQGRVKSLTRVNTYYNKRSGCDVFRTLNSKILAPTSVCKKGYRRVSLCDTLGKGKAFKVLVHREVAKVFLPNPENLPEVNHISTNKDDNSVSNLEWVSGQENVDHYLATVQYNHHSEDHTNSVLTREDVVRISEYAKQGYNAEQIYTLLGENKTVSGNINHIVKGTTWYRVTGFNEHTFHNRFPNVTRNTYSAIFEVFDYMQKTSLKSKSASRLYPFSYTNINGWRMSRSLVDGWEYLRGVSSNFRLTCGDQYK